MHCDRSVGWWLGPYRVLTGDDDARMLRTALLRVLDGTLWLSQTN